MVEIKEKEMNEENTSLNKKEQKKLQKKVDKDLARYEKDKLKQEKKEKKKNKKKQVTKKTINLVVKESSLSNPEKWIPTVLFILLFAGAISKFAVYDLYDKVTIAEQEVNRLQQENQIYLTSIKELEDIQNQYDKYSYESFTDEELALISRLEILDLISGKILPVAEVESCAINNYEVKITLKNIDLEETAIMIQDIKSSPIVESTFINSANVLEEEVEEVDEKEEEASDSEDNKEGINENKEEINENKQELRVNITIKFIEEVKINRLAQEEGGEELAE